MTVRNYSEGAQITLDDPTTGNFTLTIDKYYQSGFKIFLWSLKIDLNNWEADKPTRRKAYRGINMHSYASISDKYIAGFIDADGCFTITVTKSTNGYSVIPCIRISQKFRKTLDDIQKYFGWGKVYTSKRGDFEYQVRGNKAKTVAMRLVKHLVLKDAQARWIIDYDFSGLKTAAQVKQIRQTLKQLRITSFSTKQFPSRKWLAGYIDGDGCFSVGFRKGRKCPRITLTIACHYTDIKALELIHKNFGGSIAKVNNVYYWTLYLQKTNFAKLQNFAFKYLQLKKEQAILLKHWFQLESYTSEDMLDLKNKMKLAKATGND
jgi:hypothetical protein